MTSLSGPISFHVKPLGNNVLPAKDMSKAVAFKLKVEDLNRIQESASGAIRSAYSELNHIRKAITQLDQPEDKWLKDVISIENNLDTLQRRLSGDPIKAQLDMDPTPSVADRINRIISENKYSSSEPTGTHQKSLQIAEKELSAIVTDLRIVLEQDLAQLRVNLQKAGAPYTPNAIPIFNHQ